MNFVEQSTILYTESAAALKRRCMVIAISSLGLFLFNVQKKSPSPPSSPWLADFPNLSSVKNDSRSYRESEQTTKLLPIIPLVAGTRSHHSIFCLCGQELARSPLTLSHLSNHSGEAVEVPGTPCAVKACGLQKESGEPINIRLLELIVAGGADCSRCWSQSFSCWSRSFSCWS